LVRLEIELGVGSVSGLGAGSGSWEWEWVGATKPWTIVFVTGLLGRHNLGLDGLFSSVSQATRSILAPTVTRDNLSVCYQSRALRA
jgi:hypothetical protein